MGIKKIILEEIKNLPRFGKETSFIIHKSGEYFMTKHEVPYIISREQVNDMLDDSQYHPNLTTVHGDHDVMVNSLKKYQERVNRYKETQPSHYMVAPRVTDNSILMDYHDGKIDINDFEVVRYYKGLIPATTDMVFEQDDLDWIRDTQPDRYRYFDVYVCHEYWYNEETGEDECDDGGSYFLKIPINEVAEIWPDYLGIWDSGGPGDEGLGVIEWAEKNNMFDPNDYGVVDYVTEIPKEEFCKAVGMSDNNKDICYGIDESVDYYLDRLVESCLILTEGVKPDMEWDFEEIKNNLDKSKKGVDTKKEIFNYLSKLFDRIKSIPERLKVKIIKYVLISFIGIIGVSQIQKIVNQTSTEPIEVNVENNKLKVYIKKPTPTKKLRIRKPSQDLVDFLKWEEGAIKDKGEPVLTAYDIGDGAITIGWGHAEPSNNTNLVAGETTISYKEAEDLLKNDIEENVGYLNKILDTWEKNGIDVNITQGMYDSMISMIFNMGIGNFRMSDFIQMVKKGEMEKASKQIEKTHVTYPGHKPRRKKEQLMFKG